MSNLTPREKAILEKVFDMSGGYVLDFNNGTFADFFGENFNIDIHSEKYQRNGTSKANKLREFFRVEPDGMVGGVIFALIEWKEDIRERTEFSPYAFDSNDIDTQRQKENELIAECKDIANRLCVGGANLGFLKQSVKPFDAKHLADQISRMEKSVYDDPALAIGTAKELIETCCRTILSERGLDIGTIPKVSELTKATIKELNLAAEDIPESRKGSDIIKRILHNLSTIGTGIAELRNLYGTGHGKHGNVRGLSPRHAKLAVGTASTLATFLFETHKETPNSVEKETQ